MTLGFGMGNCSAAEQRGKRQSKFGMTPMSSKKVYAGTHGGYGRSRNVDNDGHDRIKIKEHEDLERGNELSNSSMSTIL